MNEDLILHLGSTALKTTAMIASPMLISALVVGLLISVFQAITQINEATLTFIPKMLIVGLMLMFFGPWLLDVMANYTISLFENIAPMIRE